MKLNPYLGFDGTAEEAMKFYQSVLGGELSVMHVSDTPMCDSMPPHMHGQVMHSSLTGEGWVLMATDMRAAEGKGAGATLATNWDSLDELKKSFDRLKEGGAVEMEPGPAFWGGSFASLTDKYGVHWMMTCE